MDPRVKITKDGEVYMCIPSECADIFRDYQYELVCFPAEDPVSIEQMASKQLDFEDEELFIKVGSIGEFFVERSAMFSTLEIIKDYIDNHGRYPMGIKSIAQRNQFKRGSERGVSLRLTDDNGRTLKFFKKDRTVCIFPNE